MSDERGERSHGKEIFTLEIPCHTALRLNILRGSYVHVTSSGHSAPVAVITRLVCYLVAR